MIARRGFLGALAALATAPRVARAEARTVDMIRADDPVPSIEEWANGPSRPIDIELALDGKVLHRESVAALRRAVRSTAPGRFGVMAALVLALAAPALADQHDARNDAGFAMDEAEKLPVRDQPAASPSPSPSPSPSTDFAIDGGAGVSGRLTSEGVTQEPVVEVLAGFDLATNDKSPRLDLGARYGTAEGTTPILSEPASFRSASFEARLSQPLWKELLLRPTLMAGIEIRMATDGEKPRHQGARYICLGGQVAGEPGYFFAGICGDERVSTSVSDSLAYLPSVSASWLLRLRDLGKDLRAYLVGNVRAYLRFGYGAADAGNATATVGVLVGGGNKRAAK